MVALNRRSGYFSRAPGPARVGWNVAGQDARQRSRVSSVSIRQSKHNVLQRGVLSLLWLCCYCEQTCIEVRVRRGGREVVDV